MKTQKPPPLGTMVRISLTLPSGSTVELAGQVQKLVGLGELEGRGPGIDVSIRTLPQSVMWLIESALNSAGLSPAATTSTTPASGAQRSEAQAQNAATPAALPDTPTTNITSDDSSLEEGDALVNAEGDLIKALWQELAVMSKMNAFQLLDLPYTASDDQVRGAFQQLSKKYHPDRFTRYESFEIRELANEVFILLRDAYRAIADEGGRQKLLKAVQPTPVASPPAKPPPTPALVARPPAAPPLPSSPPRPAARVVSASAVIAESQGPSTESASHPLSLGNEAPAAQEDRVEFALRFLESGQYEQALRILRVEARKDPENTRALAGVELAAGRLALADGDRMEATQRFEAALDIDPSSERAAREIADLRRHATAQRRGLLSKLMKKV